MSSQSISSSCQALSTELLVCIWGFIHFLSPTVVNTVCNAHNPPLGQKDLLYQWSGLSLAEEEKLVQSHAPISTGSMFPMNGSCGEIKAQKFVPLAPNGDNSEGLCQLQSSLENYLRPRGDQIPALLNSASFSSPTGTNLKSTP